MNIHSLEWVTILWKIMNTVNHFKGFFFFLKKEKKECFQQILYYSLPSKNFFFNFTGENIAKISCHLKVFFS